MSDLLVLTRYTPPTRLDPAPYGTLWLQVIESFNEDITAKYIQTSKDETDPIWERMSIFLEKAYQQRLFDSEFIEDALRLYENNRGQ